MNKQERLFLYGCGGIGKLWLNRLGGERVYGFIDSNKAGQMIDGKKVFSLKEIKKIQDGFKIYISTRYDTKKEIYEEIAKNGLSKCVVGTPYLDENIYADYDTWIDIHTKFEGRNAIVSGVHLNNCKIGYASYIARNTVFSYVQIGRYSCIGPNIKVVQGQHPTKKFVSVHPMFYSTQSVIRKSYVQNSIFDEYKYTQNGYVIEVGNDVWIGDGATIMEGVCIADGTIIASGANVVKDTEPYSIVGGNPARLIRYRFNEDQIDFLIKLQWWNKEEGWIEEHAKYFDDIKRFQIKIHEEERGNKNAVY